MQIHYFPVAWPILLLLLLLAGIVFALIEVGVLHYAYTHLGVDKRWVYSLMLLSFVGSYVNIPIYRLPGERIVTSEEIISFGGRYVIPIVESWPGTVVAVNVGGAIIPTILSVYLVIKNRIYLGAAAGVIVVTAAVHALAYPVRGVGIAEPVFAPPLIAAAAGLLFSRRCSPALAYVSGSLGTLIGADLLNLDRIRGLGAPVASIGGAGTFDGIFLTGILAVLMASLFSR
jgi:uncharacterized membrane protein